MTRCKGCARTTVRLVYLAYRDPGTDLPTEAGPYGRECGARARDGLRALGVTVKVRHARA